MKYLIDNVESWWTLWSVRLAALAGVIASYLAANPEQVHLLLSILPDGPLRAVVSIGVGLFVFGLATGSRLVKQPEKRGLTDANPQP